MAEKRSMKNVCVIGAGAAGLCCARLLKSLDNCPDIVVYEKTSTIGGVWVYSEEAYGKDGVTLGHDRMYKNMRVNLPKEIMSFPNFPFDPTPPSFIHHTHVLSHLEDFARHFSLYQHIQFKREVVEVSPVEAGNPWTKWLVVSEEPKEPLEGGTDSEQEHKSTSKQNGGPSHSCKGRIEGVFDAVLVCNGHYYRPNLSSAPDLSLFKGRVSHSCAYRDPILYRGENVLLVGTGPSGRDIVIDVATEAKHIYLSSKRPPLPSKLPSNVTQVAKLHQVTREGVEMADGRVLDVDSILLCTGYEYDFPFLSPASEITLRNNRIHKLYKHTFNVSYPSMAFVGICTTVLPWPMFHQQVEWILSMWFGDRSLPPRKEMEEASDKDHQWRVSCGLKPHFMGPHQWAFRDELMHMSGLNPATPLEGGFGVFWRKSSQRELYDAVAVERSNNLMSYKNKTYKFDNGKWKEVAV